MKFDAFIAFSDEVSANYRFLLGLLNTEHEPSVKKTGQPGRSASEKGRCGKKGLRATAVNEPSGGE